MKKFHFVLILSILNGLVCFSQNKTKVSILGDSYSTFEGYLNPDSNKTWYYKSAKNNTDVTSVDQTWWDLFIKKNSYTLDVNNSFSGSTISNTGYRNQDYSDRSFIARMNQLGKPDIIFIFGATNDSWANVPIGEYQYKGWTKETLYTFRPAMAYMLSNISNVYPKAKIYFLLHSELKEEIIESVKVICKHFQVDCIELRDIDKKSGHPSIKGMQQISDQIQAFINNKDNRFQIARFKDNKECAISYTFDDGLKEHYTLVNPQLKKLKFKATFWINGSKINKEEQVIKDTTRMSWKNLKEMADDGHEISNHGWEHKNFRKFSLHEIKEDIEKNDSAILKNIGLRPKSFCYPNNTKTVEGVLLASKNRVGTRTEQRSVGGKSTIENLDAWTNQLLRDKDWGVTMTHGITYGYDHFKSADILWQHLKHVKTQESRIWVGTFAEIASYIKERDSTLLTATRQGRDEFIVTPACSLDKELYQQPLTAIVQQNNIRRIAVNQDGKKLETKIQKDQALFYFDPFGGPIMVKIKKR